MDLLNNQLLLHFETTRRENTNDDDDEDDIQKMWIRQPPLAYTHEMSCF